MNNALKKLESLLDIEPDYRDLLDETFLYWSQMPGEDQKFHRYSISEVRVSPQKRTFSAHADCETLYNIEPEIFLVNYDIGRVRAKSSLVSMMRKFARL